ncbi:hypothetical protein UCRPC4_g04879 [Phaeomoniella chlamydospora]|uniref:GET complex, subunit GET2 n=1 Tax=Phaeomoniella chlamydospora TaxID=158046 RepID=A0A0G2G3Z2_PHACM|nr:hypothetical protein UCRPC4_g04879 [Phaeomoniella chlamydospora]
MSEGEETPVQKQVRIRRERREAKIKAGGVDRLERITRASGRTPESIRQDSPLSSPGARSTISQSPTPSPQPSLSNAADPTQIQAQEEFLRSLLRQQAPAEAGAEQQEDPMIRMMQSMLGGDPSDPNAPEMPSFSADDVSKATGIPSFVTNLFLGKAPETEQQKRQVSLWKMIHGVFSVLLGIYTVWMVQTSIASFGANPPTPPMVWNPFLVFVMGELLVEGTRLTLRGMGSPKGIGAWYQLAKDLGRDGSVVVFFLGISMWWSG